MTTNGDRCTEWRALASCRLDGELDELQTARLERHLSACAACRSWAGETAALAALLHQSESELPVLTFAGRGRTLRRRLERTAAVGATAASAAAVAAFAFAQLGGGLSAFSTGNTQLASSSPCASCTKKQALTSGAPSAAVLAGAPVHVANPLAEPTIVPKRR